MKNLFFILFVFLISCSTPEQKIIKSFKEGRSHKYNREIKRVEIYDTIYTQSILDSLPVFEERLDKFYTIIRNTNNLRDSVFNLKHPKSITDSLLKVRFDHIRKLNAEVNHLTHQKNQYLNFYNTHDTICGYFAKIYAEKDTFDVVVVAKSYFILCPTFIFKNEPPIYRINFN